MNATITGGEALSEIILKSFTPDHEEDTALASDQIEQR